MSIRTRTSGIMVNINVLPAAATGLPLDGLSPTGAWSTRKLMTAYAGNCMQVRRSSDDGIVTVGFSGNELDTAGMLAAMSTASNAFIVTWYDQSGNGHDVTQSSTNKQPQIVSSGTVITTVNGNPSPLFTTGTATQLLTATTMSNFINSSAYTALGSVNVNNTNGTIHGDTGSGATTDSTATGGFWWGGGAFGGGAAGAVPTVYWGFFSGGYREVSTTAVTFPSVHVTLGRYDSTNLYGYLDGGTAFSSAETNAVGNLTNSGLQIGNNTQDAFATTHTLEAVVFNSFLSAANCNTIGSAFASRAGTTWTNIS